MNNSTKNNVKILHNNNINLSLSFNNLTYTLLNNDKKMNSSKYLNSYSLIFNIEDEDTIYNVFKHNDIQFTYQLNNILFIDNDKNMHILNYNLKTQDKFSIDNNRITFNVLNNSSYEFNEQTIYAYNSNNISYIYSNEDKLRFIENNKSGLYTIDNDNIILNSNKLLINIDKFNYNYLHVNDMINKNSYIINNYSYNIELFGKTKKYKHLSHTNNLSFIKNYNNCDVNIITSNQCYKYKIYNEENNIINKTEFYLKNTEYFIIDLPIEYEYETVINKDFKFNKILCPVNINSIDIEIPNSSLDSNITSNEYKSFIHNTKTESIKYDNKIDSKSGKVIKSIPKIKEHCNVSLFFDVNKDIYRKAFNNPNDNKINIIITYHYNSEQEIKYEFVCYVDIMYNQFKKLYHNYNYGFNFDNHGEAIGILLYQHYSDNNSNNINNTYINCNNEEQEININAKTYSIDKDVFVNYNSNSFNKIFVKTDELKFPTNRQLLNNNFNQISYNNNNTGYIYDVEITYYPKKLKYKNFTLLNKENPDNKISLLDYENTNENYLLYNITSQDNKIYLYEYLFEDNTKVVNNPYIMDNQLHKSIFNNIYNYRKSGLLCGDFYTPCLSDYMLMHLFEIEKYFDCNIYDEYINKIYKEKIINDKTVCYRLLANQFYTNKLNHICQYNVNLTKKSSSDESFEPNNFFIDYIDKTKYEENPNMFNQLNYDYIWPLFRIPDYSIINSNDYIIMYSDKENCEYVDYYTNLNECKYFYINFRIYNKYDIEELQNIKIFTETFKKIFTFADENKNIIYNIHIIDILEIDKKNDIYQMKLYVKPDFKMNIIYIIFKDSEDYVNNIMIDNDKYRILCKVYLKNTDN